MPFRCAGGECAFAAGATLLVFAAVLFVPQIFADGDTYWHLAAGGWVLEHRAVPHADPFSGTFAGQAWTAHEWLAEVLMALAYRAGGWSGVAILVAAAAGAAVGLLAQFLRRVSGAAWPAAVLLLLAAPLIAPVLLARPHILALPLLVAWAAGLLRARAEERAPSPWLLPLMMLWANLHGGFALGLALLLPLGAEAVLAAASHQDRTKALLGWGGFVAAAFLAVLATPHGVDGLLFPVRLLRMQSLSMIKEWQGLDFSQPQPFEAFLLAVLAMMSIGRLRLPPLRLLVFLGLIHMALSHQRNDMVTAVLGVMFLAEPFGQSWRSRAAQREATRADQAAAAPGPAHARHWTGAGALAGTAALLLPLALSVTRLAVPIVRGDDPASPVSALSAVPPDVLSRPVFNEYDLGGYLIFSGARPFIDGRADLYGDAFMARYSAMRNAGGTALAAALDDYGIAWTILAPDGRIEAEMDRLPGWQRIHADAFAVVHVRRRASDAPPRLAGR